MYCAFFVLAFINSLSWADPILLPNVKFQDEITIPNKPFEIEAVTREDSISILKEKLPTESLATVKPFEKPTLTWEEPISSSTVKPQTETSAAAIDEHESVQEMHPHKAMLELDPVVKKRIKAILDHFFKKLADESFERLHLLLTK